MELKSANAKRSIETRLVAGQPGSIECVISESAYHVAFHVLEEALETEEGRARVVRELEQRLNIFIKTNELKLFLTTDYFEDGAFLARLQRWTGHGDISAYCSLSAIGPSKDLAVEVLSQMLRAAGFQGEIVA